MQSISCPLENPENCFESTSIHTAHFGDNNELYIQLNEEVRIPEILHYNLIQTAEDLFILNIYWAHIYPVSSYTYHICLNGEELGQTIEKSYSISNLARGEYEIIIIPETSSGTLHETGLSFSINQFDFIYSSVETFSQPEDVLPLYDLNGRIVKNVTPGIYIRGGKKVIIR